MEKSKWGQFWGKVYKPLEIKTGELQVPGHSHAQKMTKVSVKGGGKGGPGERTGDA